MAAAKPSPGDIDAVVGANVARIRSALGATHDDLGQALRDRGWAAASGPMIVLLERGERAFRLSETLLLADALNVAVAELLRTDELVHLGGSVADRGDQLTRRLTNAPHQHRIRRAGQTQRLDTWAALEHARRSAQFSALGRHSIGAETMREAERHAAQRLGITPDEIVRRSYARWDRTLTEERDARARTRVDDDASARHRATVRAHVTRELLTELRSEGDHE